MTGLEAAPRPGCHMTWDPDEPGMLERLRELGRGVPALTYAGLGYAVTPLYGVTRNHGCSCRDGMACRHAGKHPRLSDWNRTATHDPTQIEGWWRHDPNSNVGVATGQVSRTIVVDVDRKNGKDGPRELRAWIDRAGLAQDELRPTPYQVTPTGSYQLWYALPCEWRDADPVPSRSIPGVDFLGDARQVVASPSQRWVRRAGLRQPGDPVPDAEYEARGYEWVGCPHELAEISPRLLEAILNLEAAPGAVGAGGNLAGLDHYLEHGVPPGERDVTFNALACSLFRRYGDDPERVRADLLAVYAATDTTDFPLRQLDEKIRRARRFIGLQRERERELMRSLPANAGLAAYANLSERIKRL